MPHKTWLFLLVLVLLVGCAPKPTPTPRPTTPPPTPTEAAQAETIHILRLDSNHAEFAWSGEIKRGVLDGLKDNGFEVDGKQVVFEDYYLDTKRNTSQDYFEQVGEETIAYIKETQPDIVIVNDDNATRLVVQPMRDEGIRFMLLGLNGKPEEYELDGSPNVAGVLERPHATEMMDWIEKVFGKTARVAFLAEDSLTSERMFGDGSVEATVKATDITFVDLTLTNDFAEWQEYVLNAPETSDVLFLGAYSTLREADDKAVEPLAALKWTLENSEIPVMGFWEEAVHIGTLGGPIISGYTQGYEAAVQAAKILNGTSPDEIGFSAPPRGKLMINRNAVEQWDVKVPLDLMEVSEIVTQ